MDIYVKIDTVLGTGKHQDGTLEEILAFQQEKWKLS